MNVSEEELMAYVDGELDDARRVAIERAVASQPELARRVAAEKGLRDRIRGAFDRVLNEPVPSRLLDSTTPRQAVAFHRVTALPRTPAHLWKTGLAAAAGIVLGLVLSPWLLQRSSQAMDLVAVGANLEARGRLANDLSQRLGSERASPDGIRLGVSYLAKTGHYCRTFVLDRNGGTMSGLACRNDAAWQVQVLQSADRPLSDGTYRQAGSALSPLIARAVDDSIVGDALDASGEARARDLGWRVPAGEANQPH